VRALRELGVDLAAIRTAIERQAGLAELARTHAEAIDVHVHQLTLRRAVLRALARGISRPEEVIRMNAFARASADEARRVMEEFLNAVFVDQPEDPFAARMRAALPELPEEPSAEQIDAWIELARLATDPAFRSRVRQMVTEGARQRAAKGISHTDKATQAAGEAVVKQVGAAIARSIEPGSPDAGAVIDELVGVFAAAASWPPMPSLIPVYEWFVAALRAA
jgi:hypothetical protein